MKTVIIRPPTDAEVALVNAVEGVDLPDDAPVTANGWPRTYAAGARHVGQRHANPGQAYRDAVTVWVRWMNRNHYGPDGLLAQPGTRYIIRDN